MIFQVFFCFLIILNAHIKKWFQYVLSVGTNKKCTMDVLHGPTEFIKGEGFEL